MRISSKPTISLLSSLALASLVACTTDAISIEALEVSNPQAAAAGTLAAVVISTAYDVGEVDLHLNGAPLVDGGQIISLSGVGSFAFSIQPNTYVVELIDSDGDVVLQTTPLELSAKHLNAITAYGDASGLAYHARSDDWDASPKGMVRANFSNATARQVIGDLEVCSFDGGAKSCEVLVEDMPFGGSWSGDVAIGSRFEFSLDENLGPVEFWSTEFGEGFSLLGARVQNYAPVDWVDFDDLDCPGCISSIESFDDMFRE